MLATVNAGSSNMFHNQPLSIRFGGELERHLDDPSWSHLDIAVAWVRASGVAYLDASFRQFLDSGGAMSIVVGLDLQNTTKEGLEALLALEECGNCEIYVFHNEAAGVFHPKIYLFRNNDFASLIVGSNNLTESGLFVNVEAALELEAAANDSVILEASDALSSWKDEESGFAKRLDADLLQRLVDNNYVPLEGALGIRIANTRRQRQQEGRERLFGSQSFRPPRLRRDARIARSRTEPRIIDAATRETLSAVGAVLLMRLRKAHTVNRPTQTQIPIRVLDSGFFGDDGQVRSRHTGANHEIHEAAARGGRNTLKLEIPEMRAFGDPLIRFERTPEGIVYQTYDIGTPQGNQIMGTLRDGLRDESTQLTLPSSPERSTWWRFI